LRLLTGRLTAKDAEAKQTEWLDLGRKPYEALFDHKEDPATELDRKESELIRRQSELIREQLFPTTDTTPEAVREAAYRVEMRRSLLQATDNLAITLLAAAIFAAGAIAWYTGQWWSVALAVAGVILAAWVRRQGTRQAIKVVPWRQGLEPLAWALYYPAQMAQKVLAANEELLAEDITIKSKNEALQATIERGPDDRVPPDQYDKLLAYDHEMKGQLPQRLSSVDSSRYLARYLSDRAAATAELIRREILSQVDGGGRRNWARSRARGSMAEAFAKRAYNYLMSESAGFAMLPRPQTGLPEEGITLRTFTQDQSIQLLVARSESLIAAAEKAAQGYWPAEPSAEWERPPSRVGHQQHADRRRVGRNGPAPHLSPHNAGNGRHVHNDRCHVDSRDRWEAG
jgi:hypothetical protein